MPRRSCYEKNEYELYFFPFNSHERQIELMKGETKATFFKNFLSWSEVGEKYAEEIKDGRIEL